MRVSGVVVLLWAARAVAEPAPASPPLVPPPLVLPWHAGFSFRGGVHHTHVSKTEGEPDGYGPRFELELTVRPFPELVLAGFAAYSRYTSDHLYDGIARRMYDVSFETWGLGGRVYLEPHPRFFLGVGVFDQSETEGRGIGGGRYAPQDTDSATHWQFLVGGNVLQLGRYTFQVAGMYTQYEQYFSLEHVVTYGLVFGVHGE